MNPIVYELEKHKIHLSTRLLNGLTRFEVKTIQELLKIDIEEFKKLRGIGIGCIEELQLIQDHFSENQDKAS